MKETTCSNGHIYDSDVYSACPYCNGGGVNINFDGNMYDEPEKTTLGRTQMGYADIGKTFMDDGEDSLSGKTEAPAGFGRDIDTSGETVSGDTVSEDPGKTVGLFDNDDETKPVVGWLVCVEGPEKGKDYRIYCKINTIGRSKKMDISINDPTISRDYNARLSYEPRNNEFYLMPAESSNNIYINNKVLYVPTMLSPYDCIEFGKSKMLFVPFCCDRFTWDAPEKKS